MTEVFSVSSYFDFGEADSIKNLAQLGGVGGRRYSCREIEVLFIKSSYLVYVGMIY